MLQLYKSNSSLTACSVDSVESPLLLLTVPLLFCLGLSYQFKINVFNF